MVKQRGGNVCVYNIRVETNKYGETGGRVSWFGSR